MAASQATAGLTPGLVSLHDLGHVLCIVWPGKLEDGNIVHWC